MAHFDPCPAEKGRKNTVILASITGGDTNPANVRDIPFGFKN
jgi:hypothetical protein